MRKIALLLSILALAACSKEPSGQELESAVRGQYTSFNSKSASLGATSLSSQFIVHSVKKVGCKKMSQNSEYSCDVEVDLTAPQLGRYKSIKTIKLSDEGDAWQVLNVF